MKRQLIFILFAVFSINFTATSQDLSLKKFNPEIPQFITPTNHNPNFIGNKKGYTKSFYESKSEWQHIIDTTWGPGDSLEQKLLIFNTYAKEVRDKFVGFTYLNIDWDSLYNHYLSQITESTSKGAFASIMGHFAYDLKDGSHTWATDNDVFKSALNPGVPILVSDTYNTVEHFGAVTTVLADTTTLVLRVAPNHPLNLEPGDIILGYENVPWKYLIRELREAGLPVSSGNSACKSANTYLYYSSAGMNWHLFNTIDVLKYATGDTVHLSVHPLTEFIIPPMVNNEQLKIDNVPFPKILPFPGIFPYPTTTSTDSVVTYGIIKETNIGYIYLVKEDPEALADLLFYNAINALKNTDGLIIDIRKNYGGWALFDRGFDILFNEFQKTMDDLKRCNPNTFELCPYGSSEYYRIEGLRPDYYDRPIAVLIGPGCVSMGDITAHRLRYHPMARFFGASPPASYSGVGTVVIPGWGLSVGAFDMYHLNDPDNYLNGKEFPIDFPVWFNKDDVAAGKDPIVEKALDWMNSLSYAHNIAAEKNFYSAGSETATIKAIIENPQSHDISARLIFESLDGTVIDSSEMTKVSSGDGNEWQGQWKTSGPTDNTYWVSARVTDNTSGTSFNNKHATRITTTPILIDSMTCVAQSGFRYNFRPYLLNGGSHTINGIKVKPSTTDPWVVSVTPSEILCPSLLPGKRKAIGSAFVVKYDTSISPDPLRFNIQLAISSEDWPYWLIDTTITIIPDEPDNVKELHSKEYSISQNYPNPFSLTTTIGYGIKERSNVKITVLNAIGKEVAVVLDTEKEAGNYVIEFNAKNLPAGVYYYQLKAGGYVHTKKMIVLK
jgi:hypothetical protein